MSEKLEKRSKNVREKTRTKNPKVIQSRLLQYIRSLGFRPRPAKTDSFGLDEDGRGIRYTTNEGGNVDHEVGHALQTPVGESLAYRQRSMGTPQGDSGWMRQPETRNDEGAASSMEPMLRRRAGVGFADDPGRYQPRGEVVGDKFVPDADHVVNRARAQEHLGAFEEGRKTIDPQGRMVQGTSVDAKINARAMKKSEGGAKWLDKYTILDPEHKHDLDTRAAINEFMKRLPRHEAEAAAHAEYRHDQLVESAAHHYNGLMSSHATGAKDEAKKHAVMYALAMKDLGHDPVAAPPPEVASKAKNISLTDPSHKFKAHPADSFVLPSPQEMEQMQEASKKKPLAKSIKAIPKGNQKQNPSVKMDPSKVDFHQAYDYSHVLPETARAKGMQLEVHHTKFTSRVSGEQKEFFKAHLIDPNSNKKEVGKVNGIVRQAGSELPVRFEDEPGSKGQYDVDSLEPHSELHPDYHGQGLGTAMYEALYSHAFSTGIDTVHGGMHSADAHRLHERLAKKHGFTYRPRDDDTGQPEYPYGSYQYALKSEIDGLHETTYIGPGKGVVFSRQTA